MPYGREGEFVSMAAALNSWVPYAVVLLEDTARKYNGFVTYKQLGEYVQEQSGVSHNAVLSNWIGDLLARVINHCTETQVPQLSALCVKEDGTVGDGYRHAMLAGGQKPEELDLDQLDDHAAETRLECYRHFGAELPPGGGEPNLTPRAKVAREWKIRQKKLDEPPKVCPNCFMVLPVTGACDNCA